MSDIFESNCACIAKHNNPLSDKLKSLGAIDKNINIDTNLADEYNLVIDGLPVHSLTGAVNEAKEIVRSIAHNDYGTLHVIYGIGLGYLADEFVQSLKGKVIVYEPDLQVLAFVLSAVDFSENFKTDRLFFVTNISELKKVLYELYRYKANATFSYLDYYKTHGRDFNEIAEFLKREIILIDHNYNFQVNNTRSFFFSTLKRLAEKYKLKRLSDYKDTLKDVPAIIVSAGPSLSKNIDVLKQYTNKAVVFSVGTALPTLYNNGITPDFANVIERINTSHHYRLPFSKDISFICEQFSEPSYLDIEFKERFLTNSLENDDARWFLEKAEAPFVDFETKGTVAYHALYCAYYLGCNPIILLGQDLAYSDGSCYSKGSKFEDLACIFDSESQKYKIEVKDFEKFKNAYCASVDWSEDKKNKIVKSHLKHLNANLVTVKGQNNNLLATDSVYSLFIDYLQGFASKHKEDITLVNASIGGALIKGFETMPLDETMKKYVSQNFDKTSALEKFYCIKNSACFDIGKVKRNITKDIDVIKKALKIAQPAAETADRLLTVYQTEEKHTIKSQKLLDELTEAYVKIVNEYMLKHRIIKMLTVKEYSDIAYLKREKSQSQDYSSLNELAHAYYSYFNSCVLNLNNTITILEQVIKELEN